jgi:hypothetical protein
MALTTIASQPVQPGGVPLHFVSGGLPTANILIDGSAEKFAVLVEAPIAGEIETLEFKLGTVGQAPANGLRISLQDMDLATGLPDGTSDQFRVVTSGISSNAWVAPGRLTSDGTDGGTRRTVAAGNLFFVVGEFQAYNTGDSVNISGSSYSSNLMMFPYGSLQFISSWTKLQNIFLRCILKYSDGSYFPLTFLHMPWSTDQGASYNTTTSPDEVGLKFTVTAKARLKGVWFRHQNAASYDRTVRVYDSTDLQLSSTTWDKDIFVASHGWVYYSFAPPVVLAAGAVYRITMLAVVSSPNVVIDRAGFESSAIRQAWAGHANTMSTQRTDLGAWTDTDTIWPLVHPVFDQFDDGAGSPSQGVGRFVGPRRTALRRAS